MLFRSALEMMEHTTWLTAEQAQERGLIDAVMFRDGVEAAPLTAGPLFSLPTKEQMDRADRAMKAGQRESDSPSMEQVKFNLLKLRGEKR